MAAGFSVYYIVLYCIVFYVCAQSCPTVCDHMDCSLPGSSVHGFLQAKILECVPISYPRGSSLPRDQTQVFASPTLTGGFFTASTISLCWCPNAPALPSPERLCQEPTGTQEKRPRVGILRATPPGITHLEPLISVKLFTT